eukprot:12898733-Prorocentrum_lima.AAC.1
MPSPSTAATSRLTTSSKHDTLCVDSHVEQSRVGTTASGSVIPPLQSGHKDPWQHAIDTCTIYTQANTVTSRTAQSLLRGLRNFGYAPLDHHESLNQIKNM